MQGRESSKENISKWKRDPEDESQKKIFFTYRNTQPKKIQSLWFNNRGSGFFILGARPVPAAKEEVQTKARELGFYVPQGQDLIFSSQPPTAFSDGEKAKSIQFFEFINSIDSLDDEIFTEASDYFKINFKVTTRQKEIDDLFENENYEKAIDLALEEQNNGNYEIIWNLIKKLGTIDTVNPELYEQISKESPHYQSAQEFLNIFKTSEALSLADLEKEDNTKKKSFLKEAYISALKGDQSAADRIFSSLLKNPHGEPFIKDAKPDVRTLFLLMEKINEQEEKIDEQTLLIKKLMEENQKLKSSKKKLKDSIKSSTPGLWQTTSEIKEADLTENKIEKPETKQPKGK